MVLAGVLGRLGARRGLVHHLMCVVVLSNEHDAVLAVVSNDGVGRR